MMRYALIALAASAGTPANAQPIDEKVTIAPTPGLIVGYTAARDGITLEERVPDGETVHDWSRMVTIQRFLEQPGISAEALLGSMRAGWGKSCPGSRTGAVTQVPVAGRTGSALRADCLLNPATGKPETMFARAVMGTGFLHVVQVAYRHAPSAAEAAWSETLLGTIDLCSGARCR